MAISTGHAVKLFTICIVLTTITNFPSGFTNSSVNTAILELNRFLNESYQARGWSLDEIGHSFIRSATLNCWFIAQIFGSILSPLLTDRYGRKIAYICATLVMLLAAILQYIATVFGIPELLIAGRSLCALCSPLSDAALILYLQECSPLGMRGAFSFLGEIGYGFMCVLGLVLGMRSVLGHSLPLLLGVSIIPQVFFVIFLLFIPETPKFLMITRNDRVGALKSLEFYQGRKKENETLLDEYMRESQQEGDSKRSNIREIFCTWHLRQALILSCLVFVLTLSFYPVLQSSTSFFTEIGIRSEVAEISSTTMMVVLTIASILGSTFIDRYPRRLLLLLFGALSYSFLLLFVIFSVITHHSTLWWLKYASLGFMACYCVAYGMVLGPISWFVGPELVPQKHRSSVFCLCYAINNILITITNFTTIQLYHHIGAYTFVPLFIVPSVAALIYLYLYLPETRGRETHAIVESMRRKKLRDVASSSDFTPEFSQFVCKL